MEIKNAQQFTDALKFAYTELGMYPKYFITSDGAALSWQSAKNNAEIICQAIEDKSSCGWCVVACDVNWEDGQLYCDHSGKRIESAYAEDAEPEPANRTGMITVIQMSHNFGENKQIAESELRMKLGMLKVHADALGLWLDFNPEMPESYTHETL